MANAQQTPDPEVRALSRQIASAHRADVARLACLVFTTAHIGENPAAWGSDLREALKSLQLEFQAAWMAARGITQSEVDAALVSLTRAETTVAYLDSLPA